MLIQVVLGTTREARLSAVVGRWIACGLSARDQLQVEVVDLRDHPLPFFDGEAPAKTLASTPTPR